MMVIASIGSSTLSERASHTGGGLRFFPRLLDLW
jgi:hypothetical protein